jgi:type IV pilus assembly protein PilA
MFCALCAADNPNDGRFCNKCGAVLQGQRAMGPPGEAFGGSGTPYAGATETSGKAIGSLICGLLFFLFPSAIAAIILGHFSLSDARKAGGRLTGQGIATTGLVLGYMGVAVVPFVLIVAAITIPNLLRAKIAANEASAVGSLRTINMAATIYQTTYSNGFPPGLAAMDGVTLKTPSCDHAGLLDSVLASGQRSGYMFIYVPTTPPNGMQSVLSPEAEKLGCTAPGAASFEVHADPVQRGTTGQRSFYADQSGVIRFNADAPATTDSSPLQ